MRVFSTLLTILTVLASALPAVADPTILGAKLDYKEKPGFPITRRLKITAQEYPSDETLFGDPVANGATVVLIFNGATSTTQTIDLPAGADRWRRGPLDPMLPPVKWRYRDSLRLGFATPLYSLDMGMSASGKIKLTASLTGRYVPLDIAAPNPGSYAGMVITIGGGGGTYCVNFGGVAGGTFARNDAIAFRIAKPTAEGVCPSGTPVCGDGVIQSPFENCDVGNDAACPGLCGANGLACICPFCGDQVIDPGEQCDRPNLGSCTEGCSYTCQCAVCGDGVVQTPVEGCEPDGDPLQCEEGTCGAVGGSNQCQCPACGDNIVNRAAEQCDGTDDSACPGNCVSDTCLCAVCGNNVAEGTEQCDGSDNGNCVNGCAPACVCAVCGNGITEGFEQCDGADDAACPSQCQADCTCP
jgi:hypothetical protein